MSLGRERHVAEVAHECIGLPAEEELNGSGVETHDMEQDASANSDGVRAPTLELQSILRVVRIQTVHLRC